MSLKKKMYPLVPAETRDELYNASCFFCRNCGEMIQLFGVFLFDELDDTATCCDSADYFYGEVPYWIENGKETIAGS